MAANTYRLSVLVRCLAQPVQAGPEPGALRSVAGVVGLPGGTAGAYHAEIRGGLDVDAVMRARQRLVRAAVLSYIWGWRLSWHENAVSFATPQWSARTRSY